MLNISVVRFTIALAWITYYICCCFDEMFSSFVNLLQRLTTSWVRGWEVGQRLHRGRRKGPKVKDPKVRVKLKVRLEARRSTRRRTDTTCWVEVSYCCECFLVNLITRLHDEARSTSRLRAIVFRLHKASSVFYATARWGWLLFC